MYWAKLNHHTQLNKPNNRDSNEGMYGVNYSYRIRDPPVAVIYRNKGIGASRPTKKVINPRYPYLSDASAMQRIYLLHDPARMQKKNQVLSSLLLLWSVDHIYSISDEQERV